MSGSRDLKGHATARKEQADAEKRIEPEPKQVSVHLQLPVWIDLRTISVVQRVSASAIISALVERFIEADDDDEAKVAVLKLAKQIGDARAANRNKEKS